MPDETTAPVISAQPIPTQSTQTPLPTVDSLRSPQFIIAMMLILLLWFIVVMVFFRADATLINTVTSLTIGTVLGALTGFYFGSSTSSQRKDVLPIPPTNPTA